ncbi:MAG TPA: M15 family metallopeptidase [Chlamydiales bacterium]|jgi:D-alanyl-D-alanine dipeptidase|nr:M15 family metallopeptidase [Chlamydiales bacterium]
MKQELIRLQEIIPGIKEDLVYATVRNFTGRAVYPPTAVAFLRKKVAERLKKVQIALKNKGLGLKIYDAYRPLAVQRKFWELVPDPRYVGNPAIGSKHNRGAAVDLTLVDDRGIELLMPSGFDDFSERAHRNFENCEPERLENRELLQAAMENAGFLVDREKDMEWWHFDDPEWNSYSILDIPFEHL